MFGFITGSDNSGESSSGSIGTFFGTITKPITSNAPSMPSIDMSPDVLLDLSKGAQDLFDTSTDLASDALDTSMDLASDVADASMDLASNAVETVTDTVNDVVNQVNALKDSFTHNATAGYSTAIALQAILSQLLSAGADAASDTVSDAVNTASDSARDVEDTMTDTASDLADGAQDAGNAAADAVGGAVDSYNNLSDEQRDGIHLALDIAGFVPVIGEAADVANGILYLAEGDYVNAGISFVSAIPVAGDSAKAGRFAIRGADMAASGAKLASSGSKLATRGARIADGAVTAHRLFNTANDAYTIADLSARVYNAMSAGSLGGASKGLTLNLLA
jgi:hypothetical protein